VYIVQTVFFNKDGESKDEVSRWVLLEYKELG